MNKAVTIIIGIVVVVGAVFALKNFYNPSVEPQPTSTTSQTPPAQVIKTPTPTTTPEPATVNPPTTLLSVLDRIEAAIRAKLKR